jgi:dipeptidyl aminopeptidase/acylaminoacyl peptidase
MILSFPRLRCHTESARPGVEESSMKPFAMLLSALLLVLPNLAAAQAPKPYEIADFVREDKFREVSVSPKGTYVAVTVPFKDQTLLYVLKSGQTQPLTRIAVEGKHSHVVGVFWVSDERLVYSVAIRDQLDERPAQLSELWAIDADGGKRVQLAGWKRDDAHITARAGGEAAKELVNMQVINTLDDDDRNVIAAVSRFSSEFTTVERVNVLSGTRTRLAQAPVINAGFVADNRGVARFAYGFKRDRFSKLYYRAGDKDDWTLINDEATSGSIVSPLGFSADDRIAYLQVEEAKGPDSVVAFDTADGTRKPLHRDALADPTGVIHAIGKRGVIGVYYAGAQPRYVYFDPDSADARAHKALQSAFPGQVVVAGTNTTAKGDVLIHVYADREPGGYYVMNTATRKVAPMMYAADWLDPTRLAQMRDLVFTARDGRRIPVMLTLPPGSDGKHLPMVVYPHGGPYTVQDEWGYDPTVQVLASHGYAVLQVNYRGSSGYGRDHAVAGYKRWGLEMQDDLTDATRWAIDQGTADKDRICIYGASYGGYAALMGVAKEPALYKCAVGQVGVYDLGRMRSEDSLGDDYARRFFADTLNDGDLATVSPNRFAERIKVPVFLSAGREDETAPVEHTEMMEAALKKAGVPVETLYFKTEGHGIYKREHRAEFYARLLTFLQRNIGGRAPVPVADASAD